MSRGVQRARTDNNHAEIVKALREHGICAHSAATVGNGFPDVVAGFRGINVLLEVKCGQFPSQKTLTAAETGWHATWGGQIAVVDSPESAVLAVINEAKRLGVI